MTDPHTEIAELTARMRELGANDPESWASSQIKENIAQQARYLLLRQLWARGIDGWRDHAALRRVPVTARLLDNNADPYDLSQALRLAAYEAVFALLSVLDEGHDPEAPDDAPGWQLMETDATSGELTGRDVGGLHESILSLDPSGREGSDLFR
jgi:hypothetical protein